ncbi:MAG: DUF4157 domain-containing protein, partial [Chitinivibrionales bacterium]|nr:DUF4157 domain-containing protein [Chitinivibrionales bacterium]MBD3357851.1 DUF4157 domain-containing protein [Chitinivibrionales bacterium]
MAQKDFKRKTRRASDAVNRSQRPSPVAEVATYAKSGRSRTLGAPYRSRAAFSLGILATSRPEGEPPTPNQESASVAYPEADWLLKTSDPGDVLPARQKQRLEKRFGHDFGDVRLHTGPSADQACEALSAVAFTYGNHLWLHRRTNPTSERVLAHELTHVVHQGYARPLGPRTAISLSNGRAVAPRVRGEASAYRGTVARTAGRLPTAGATIQRWSVLGGLRRLGGRMVSGVRTVRRGIVRVGQGLMNLGRRGLMAVVRRVAPDFGRLFERGGIRGFLRTLIARGFRGLFGGVVNRVRSLFRFGGIGARLRSIGEVFSTVVQQLARNDCSALTRAARSFAGFMSRTFEPITSRIRLMADAIAGFFRDIWNAVGVPIMRFLRMLGGAVWRSIRRFIGRIGEIIGRVKNALGGAWTRVKRWFGIEADEGTGEGGGVWNWIRDKAAAVWDSIKGPLQPVLGPLRVVGGVLLVLSPIGPILLVIQAWPYLRRAFGWLRERWRDLNL